jgi:thiamine biosynthesis lipoprotein
MPLIETLPVGADTAQWTVWGTVARVVVTDPAALTSATAIVRAELAAVDAACSRFRSDAELTAVCRSPRPVTVSPLLADLMTAALEAARQTGGDVDPTVGGALCGLGCDRLRGADRPPGCPGGAGVPGSGLAAGAPTRP